MPLDQPGGSKDHPETEFARLVAYHLDNINQYVRTGQMRASAGPEFAWLAANLDRLDIDSLTILAWGTEDAGARQRAIEKLMLIGLDNIANASALVIIASYHPDGAVRISAFEKYRSLPGNNNCLSVFRYSPYDDVRCYAIRQETDVGCFCGLLFDLSRKEALHNSDGKSDPRGVVDCALLCRVDELIDTFSGEHADDFFWGLVAELLDDDEVCRKAVWKINDMQTLKRIASNSRSGRISRLEAVQKYVKEGWDLGDIIRSAHHDDVGLLIVELCSVEDIYNYTEDFLRCKHASVIEAAVKRCAGREAVLLKFWGDYGRLPDGEDRARPYIIPELVVMIDKLEDCNSFRIIALFSNDAAARKVAVDKLYSMKDFDILQKISTTSRFDDTRAYATGR